MSSDPSVMAASSVISLIGLITFLVITFVRRARER
jgi:hypothetical protein